MSALQDRPSLANILATVQEFLEHGTEISAAQLRFRAQVSAFLLGVAEREMALGAELDRQASAALASFAGKVASLDELIDNFCREARAGAYDGRFEAALEVALALTVAKVKIVRPEHLAPQHRS
jgi:hypothetical protein